MAVEINSDSTLGKKQADYKSNRFNDANLGNILVEVSSVEGTGENLMVKGKVVYPEYIAKNVGDIDIGLLKPEHAANLFKGKNNESFDERVDYFKNQMKDRIGISDVYDALDEGKGIIRFNNVVKDFSTQKFYGNSAYGVVTNPELEALNTGYFDVRSYPREDKEPGVSVSIYDPSKSVIVSKDNKEVIDDMLNPTAGAYGGEIYKAAVVSFEVSTPDGKTYVNSSIASTRPYNREDGVTIPAGNLKENLEQMHATSSNYSNIHSVMAFAALAGVSGEDFKAEEFTKLSEADREMVGNVYNAAKDGDLTIAVTPGKNFNTFDSVRENLLSDGRYLDRGLIHGAVAVRHKTADNEQMTSPMVKMVSAVDNISKEKQEGEKIKNFSSLGYQGYKEAEKRHSAQNPEQAQENKKSSAPSSPSR